MKNIESEMMQRRKEIKMEEKIPLLSIYKIETVVAKGEVASYMGYDLTNVFFAKVGIAM